MFYFYVPVPEGDAAALAGGAQEGGAQSAVPHTRHSLPERLCRFKGSSHLRTEQLWVENVLRIYDEYESGSGSGTSMNTDWLWKSQSYNLKNYITIADI